MSEKWIREGVVDLGVHDEQGEERDKGRGKGRRRRQR
jgi:hypothetical protein